MSFITQIDLTQIRTPAEMARALQCLLLASLDPASAALFADSGPDDEDQERPIALHHTRFVVADQASGPRYRVIVEPAD